MTARVLVVDDILANVKLLEARLSAEYFDVLTAYNGQEALDICERERVDVVLLDVMMPGMDGFEVCRRIKADPKTMHMPVVMVTALDQPSDKVQGLRGGADDFLTKPVDDIALITRVKNLARLKTLNDEMLLRAVDRRGDRHDDAAALLRRCRTDAAAASCSSTTIAALGRAHRRWLSTKCTTRSTVEPTRRRRCCELADERPTTSLIVSLKLAEADGLRLCCKLRSLERTRHLPIIVLVEPGDEARLLRALDMGVNDYLMRPVDRNELLGARAHADQAQALFRPPARPARGERRARRHRRAHRAAQPPLHGNASEDAGRAGEPAAAAPLSVLLADIDHFKAVNDTYGHDVGRRRAARVLGALPPQHARHRPRCRFGGEEFVVIMPDTSMARA